MCCDSRQPPRQHLKQVCQRSACQVVHLWVLLERTGHKRAAEPGHLAGVHTALAVCVLLYSHHGCLSERLCPRGSGCASTGTAAAPGDWWSRCLGPASWPVLLRQDVLSHGR